MRDLKELNRYRIKNPLYGDNGNGLYHHFQINGDGVILTVIASQQQGWDYVSASARLRAPTWSEMKRVKDLFFKDSETTLLFFVPKPIVFTTSLQQCQVILLPASGGVLTTVISPKPPKLEAAL